MIVTCPNCTTKFRVRDDSVPEEGAQLKCATCSTVFMAYAPKKSDQEDIKSIVEKLKTSKEVMLERNKVLKGDNRVLEGELTPLKAKLTNIEAELMKLRTHNLQLSQEGDDLRRGRESFEQRLRDEVGRAQQELQASKAAAAAADQLRLQVDALSREKDELRTRAAESNHLKDEIVRLQGELLKVKASAALEKPEELRQLQAAVEIAQRTAVRLTVDLENTKSQLEQAKAEGGSGDVLGSATLKKEREHYRSDANRLREQLAMMVDSGREFVDPAELLNSVGPLLWGLDNAIEYIGPFAGAEPLLQGHYRQLQLLSGVIHRLQKADADDI